MTRPGARRDVVVLVSHDARQTGAPEMALRVGRTLRELGHEVRPLVRGRGPRMPAFRALGRLRRDRLRLVGNLLRSAHAHWMADRADELAAFAALLLTPGPVVWCNSLASSCYVRPALLLRRRVIVHSHEVDPAASDYLDRFGARRWARKVGLVACSPAAAEVLIRELDLQIHEVDVVQSAPAPRPLPPVVARTGPVVGSCGVPTEAKGVDLFATLPALVGDDLITWRWVGGQRPRSVDSTTEVEFLAAVPDARREIAAFDVFVTTSRAESASLVVVEAMSLGVPVVAFRVGGIPDLLGDAGLLVEPEDVHAMAAAIATLLDDRTLREHFGELGQARARDLSDPERWRASVSAALR